MVYTGAGQIFLLCVCCVCLKFPTKEKNFFKVIPVDNGTAAFIVFINALERQGHAEKLPPRLIPQSCWEDLAFHIHNCPPIRISPSLSLRKFLEPLLSAAAHCGDLKSWERWKAALPGPLCTEKCSTLQDQKQNARDHSYHQESYLQAASASQHGTYQPSNKRNVYFKL